MDETNNNFKYNQYCLLSSNEEFNSSGIKGSYNNKLLLLSIKELLNSLNQNGATGNFENQKKEYNKLYAPYVYEDGNIAADGKKKESLLLGVIDNNYNISKITHLLETAIDEIYLSNPNISVKDVLNTIKTENIFTSLPIKL